MNTPATEASLAKIYADLLTPSPLLLVYQSFLLYWFGLISAWFIRHHSSLWSIVGIILFIGIFLLLIYYELRVQIDRRIFLSWAAQSYRPEQLDNTLINQRLKSTMPPKDMAKRGANALRLYRHCLKLTLLLSFIELVFYVTITISAS